jgi:hypothetical protein
MIDGQIRAPRLSPRLLLGAGLALVATFYIFAYSDRFPQNSDLQLGLPIAVAIAHPEYYSEHDLLIRGGLDAPFHLYKLAGRLIEGGWDLELIWYIGYLISLFFSFWAIWEVGLAISRRTEIATAGLVLIILMDPFRGSLNWTWVPYPALVSGAVVVPLLYLSLALSLRGRYFIAVLLASIAAIVHPGLGLIAVSAAGFVWFFERQEPLLPWLPIFVLATLPMLPNLFAVTLQILSSAPEATGSTSLTSFEQFYLYSTHTFIDTHFGEGYAWFAWLLVFAGHFAWQLPKPVRRRVFLLVALLLGLLVLYALNLYVFRNFSFSLLFLFRTTLLLKPILLTLVLSGWTQSVLQNGLTPWTRRMTALGLIIWLVSALNPDTLAAEILSGLSGALFVLTLMQLGHTRIAVVFGFLFAALLPLILTEGIPIEPVLAKNISVVIGLVSALVFALLFSRSRLSPTRPRGLAGPHPRRSAQFSIGLMLATLLLSRALYWLNSPEPNAWAWPTVHEVRAEAAMLPPDSALLGLVSWAKLNTAAGALFAVPPADLEFLPFRFAAERGIYAYLYDVNQLVYSPAFYPAAHERLSEVGMSVEGRRRFDDSAYYGLDLQRLMELTHQTEIDYFVMELDRLDPSLADVPSAYIDSRFVVFATEVLRAE